MRKSVWIILAILFVAIGTPNAQADPTLYSYEWTNTDVGLGSVGLATISWTTEFIPLVTTDTTILAADLASSSITPTGGCSLSSVEFNFADAPIVKILSNFPITSSCDVGEIGDFDFTVTDVATPGTYVSAFDTTLTITPTPEPATGGLMLMGIGLVFAMVMRKRIARGLLLAG
jgi:hypothetical protein